MHSNNVVSFQSSQGEVLRGLDFERCLTGMHSDGDIDLTIDLHEAQRFLELLDPGASEFTFLTFDDKKQKRQWMVQQYHSDLLSVAEELTDLNEAGAGVYVTVQRTDLLGRKQENIVGVRALYADFDDGLPDNLPLEPSIKIQSSDGKYQYYWFCHQLTEDDFKSAMSCLVEQYGADKSAKDLARVLRVPGFYHNKSDPFLVRIVGGSMCSYTRQAIIEAFPQGEKARREPPADSGGALKDALGFIPASEYEVWLNVGCALHHEYVGSTEGYTIWEEWSAKAPEKFSAEVCKEKWESFSTSRQNPITLGTVFHYARNHGWNGSPDRLVWPDVMRGGTPSQRSQKNILFALQHLGIRLSFDQFAGRYFVEGLGPSKREMDDSAARSLWLLVDDLGLKCRKEYFLDVVCDVAEKNARHAVREYLDSQEWDGTPRLDRLLVDYCGAEDTKFNRIVGRKVLVAAARRVRKPGIKFDNVLVLEGSQGAGKSSFARILAGDDWFTDCVRLGDDPKLIAEQTRGAWIVELAELVGIKKKEVEPVKSMLSRQSDIARMAYHRTTSNFPRQFIFIGTTNSDEYLIDSSGNRRFWPVKVERIDLVGLARDRNQLWAEASYYEENGESIELP